MLPLVSNCIDLPIIAAGGMCDARSAAAAVVLGAEGVQKGTRMLASREALVHSNFENAIVAQTIPAQCFSTFRAIRRCGFLCTGLVARGTAQEPGVQLLGKITVLYFDGDMEASVANTGQVSSRIDELLPVADIVHSTWLRSRLC
jgi:enoyl-[acyl-carrier protein] reductase II